MSDATDLHRSALVVDAAAPSAAPGAFSAEIVARLGSSQGRTGWEVLLALESLVAESLVAGELPEYGEAWRRAGVDVAMLTVGVFGETPFARQNVLRDLDRWEALFDALPELLSVRDAEDFRQAQTTGRAGVLLHLADSAALGKDLESLHRFADLGVRSVQVTYNAANAAGSGCSAGHRTGLTGFGRELVAAMNDSRILVDLAHAGDQTTLDAIECSRVPVAVTHSVCRSVVPRERGAGDEVLRAIGESGGFFGVLLTPFTIVDDGRPSLDRWLEHFARAVELAGPGQVGIGTDWGVRFPAFLTQLLNDEINRAGFAPSLKIDWGAQMPGFERWTDWPNLTEALLGAGYTRSEVVGFLGENFLRVFDRVRSA